MDHDWMVDRSDADPAVHRHVDPLVMLAAGMVVLALVAFAAMLGFVELCGRI
jgi:hypothetical protein